MKKRGFNFVLLFFFAVSILIFINSKTQASSDLAGFAQKVFSKPLAYVYSLKVGILNTSSGSSGEIRNLKDENKLLKEKTVSFENLKRDNIALKDQFQKGIIKTQNLMAAKVIGFSGRYDFPDKLIIDKGIQDGIKNDYAVIYENNLVGIVQVSSESFSRVMLPVSKDFSVLGRSVTGNAIGVLYGKNDFVFFDKVSITDNLQKDDFVVTKGGINDSGAGIPPNMIVGRIMSVHKKENQPFQNAKVESLIDYSKLDTVFVVKILE